MSSVEVGRIAKVHGLRGELSVQMHSPESEVLASVKEVELVLSDGSRQVHHIEGVRPTPKGWLLRLRDVVSRTEAELLRGAAIYVSRSAFPELAEGETYLIDLLGAQVRGPAGEFVGEVVDSLSYPSVEVVVVRRPDGVLVELPMVEPFIESMEPEQKLIVISSLDGLVES